MGNFSEKYDQNKAKLLKQLIEKSYKKGNFTLSSGKKSSHYLNCKPVSLNGEGLNLISDLFLDLKDSRSKAVAGLTLGKYGTKAGIEGPKLEEGTLVTVLEDVVTTAGSVIKAIKKLRENNYIVEEVLSIVDRQEGGLEALNDENVKLKSLFTIKDFL